MAALLMLLTAVDEGLGACFFGVQPEHLFGLREDFGIPAAFLPIGAVSVGRRPPAPPVAGSGRPERRRPAGEVPELERWHAVLDEVRPTWCYVHAGPGVADLLRRARALGTRVALDLSFGSIERDRDAVVECAGLADVFLPNEAELSRLTATASLDEAVRVASRWCPALVVTRGPDGALVAGPDGITTVTVGVRHVEVRDRTGAGDSFAGALVGALVGGAPLLEAVAVGNAAGSAAVGRFGGVGEVHVEGLTGAARASGGAFLHQVMGSHGFDGSYETKEQRR
jgi:hypothetical protein